MTEQPLSAEAMELAERYGVAGLGDRLSCEIDALCEQRVSAETERCARIAEQAEDDHGSPDYDFQSGWIGACQEIPARIRAPVERPAPPPTTVSTHDRHGRRIIGGLYGEIKPVSGWPKTRAVTAIVELLSDNGVHVEKPFILAESIVKLIAPVERPAPEGPQLSSEASAYLAGLAEDGGYGPDDVERAAEMYPMLRPVTEEALAASRAEIDALMDPIFGPIPSALASTGEQPEGGDALLREIDPSPPAVADYTERARRLWQELLDKDDRTSPAEYPDMALITFDEFRDALAVVASEREKLT